MSAIFVSHSSRDAAFVDELRSRLVAHGHRSLFVDYDPEFGIPVGHEWEREIYQRLRSCQGIIVICSVSSMASRWVFAEVTQGKALGKHIFPVRIDDCEVDRILTERQVLDLRAGTDEAFGRLWRALELAGLDAGSLLDWDGSHPPYPGMVSFQEADAAEQYLGETPGEATRAYAACERAHARTPQAGLQDERGRRTHT
jgi:hypothetical protein